MASKTFHFKGFSIVQGDIKIKVSLSRFNKQFKDAQWWLDNAVMQSMEPFMPKQEGNFIKETEMISASMAGTGIVCAAAPPMGRFLYEGKVMVDESTGSPFAREDAKKVLLSEFTGKTNVKNENLDYFKGKNPDVTDHWFDPAKEKDLKSWVKGVKKIAGGGTSG